MTPPSTATVRAKHAEIDRRYKWAAKAARAKAGGGGGDGRGRKGFSRAGRRVNELDAVIIDFYGPVLPDDDAAHDDIFLMAHAFVWRHHEAAPPIIRHWIALHAPWMPEQETDELIQRVMDKPLRFYARALGRLLGLDEARRRRLRVTTIRAVDVTHKQRKQAKKLAARERQRARRRARKVTPRAEYLEANSLSRTKPWENLGISRRAWYYQRKGRLQS